MVCVQGALLAVLFLLQLQLVLCRSGSAPSYNRDGLFLNPSGVRASCSGAASWGGMNQ